jgi:hypothetical protein
MNDQLGPSIMAIFIEETLIPSKEQIEYLIQRLNIFRSKLTEKHQRNILVVLSCLSEKIAGKILFSI